MTIQPNAIMGNVKKSNSLLAGQVPGGMRAMSLLSRPDVDPVQIVQQAKERCEEPVKLSWENVFFEVEVPPTEQERELNPGLGRLMKKQIVKSVSGYAAPGQTTYIMGSSGAGKTSLLNILADRIRTVGNVRLSGNIVFNDSVPVNNMTFKKYAAYVMQDDILFATFTVREAVTFAARLKLKTSIEAQDMVVAKVIEELGLNHVSESHIGDIRKKVLSGGERKRCSIAVELVSDPAVILLDEPTSGLDAFKATSICQLLSNLARTKGKTVISTIHSPSSQAFYFFDRLILMADGHIMY
jgi:ABC-type multidrug transport system ATPase subunit